MTLQASKDNCVDIDINLRRFKAIILSNYKLVHLII